MEPLRQINILSEVLGQNDNCFMRYAKRTRNPDVFTYDQSMDYKEDYSLISDSACDCGCRSAVYVKEEWDGDSTYTEIKTQKEWEALPDKPKPTKEQIQLQTDILLANAAEEKLGIVHGQRSCSEIPVPKLAVRIPEMS